MIRSRKKGLGLLGRIIWLLNVIVAAGLLGSYLSSYVDPVITTIFSFLGLGYPALLFLNILFFLYWLIRRNRRLWFSLIVMIIGYQPFIKHFQIFPGREAPSDGVMNVLSYNVHNMVFGRPGEMKKDNRSRILKFLASQKTDIACLQEFSDPGKDLVSVFDKVIETSGYPYCYYFKYFPRATRGVDALVILSRYPAIDTGTLSVQGYSYRFGMYADLLIGGDTIRVYNLHMASVRLQYKDYQFVDDVRKGQAAQDDLRQGSSSILRKLHIAFDRRARQTKVVTRSLDECPYPVIICGDLNDTPLSYAYHKISDGLDDAFVKAGHRMGNTFNGNLPPVRIDYILYTPVFNAYQFEVHNIPFSDHYPISVYLSPENDAE